MVLIHEPPLHAHRQGTPVDDQGATDGEYRLGVDVGGTFTDVCVFTPLNETVRAKTPSTHPDQSIGVKNGINKVRRVLEAKYGWAGEFSSIHHGTTVATNAVLEGKGASAGLIVTEGHKDILALRRSQIPGVLGAWINFTPPEPLIPQERTVLCRERMSVDGKTVTPVAENALRNSLAALKPQNLQAVTISLINSYKNNAHEKQVARIVEEELGPGVEVVCSSDVLSEAGEYERTVTAAANAVVKPVVKQYLDGLQQLLAEDTQALRILKSDGGLTSLNVAEHLPVNLLMSGPAGGVQGVVDVIAKQTPYRNLITLDMGGTSTDCAVIADGRAAVRRETMVGDLTVKAPSVDIRTVGAGGGSIARYIELSSTLRVGPESAGATPGPACYGRGGTEPTVSDANLLLGYLPPKLLAGDFSLDVDAAASSIDRLALQVSLTREQTAEGIIQLVNETMYSALRVVSVERGHDPADFALVAFGGAGPLHANAVGKLLGAWPVIIPPSPGVLCAQGDATTRLSHETSASYMALLSQMVPEDIRNRVRAMESSCTQIMTAALDGSGFHGFDIEYEADLRYKGQALTLTISFTQEELALDKTSFSKILSARFDRAHNLQFSFSLSSFELEFMRLGVIVSDRSPPARLPELEKLSGDESRMPPALAAMGRRSIIVDGQSVDATFWDRRKLNKVGYRIMGPAIITEMDSNTLILPGFVGDIDSIGNILINPMDGPGPSTRTQLTRTLSAKDIISESPLIADLISSSLASIRNEMDTLMLRCAMSPAIRDQQDEYNVITNASGQMLVGQFGSFIAAFLSFWKGEINEGDVFITNDVYQVGGAVTHLNDVIILLPIHYHGKLIGWAANFGHLTDVGGKVPGSMSIGSTTVYDDGVQIPVVKLYNRHCYNSDLVDVLCRNSRQPDWYRSDLTALVAACRTASKRVCELHDRFGGDVYEAACNELLERNRKAVSKLIDIKFGGPPCTFTDFVDDDGHGVGPFAIKCTMERKENGKLSFDWTGTSPQSERSINYYLSETMFKMFFGYYLLSVFDPHTVINDGFHDLIEVHIPEGSVLKPVYPAAVSCRTHFLGRTMDVITALMGMKNPLQRTAAGFSDSPHFFFSGWKPSGEWFQLYQIAFGGIPARPGADGLDCHCLFPAIKSIPIEYLELNFPLRIEACEAVPDSGGPGYYRGGNAQRTLYRFLCGGEFSNHDDRWYTRAWGIDGGEPGTRSRKVLYQYSLDPVDPPVRILPSKCDYIRVAAGDLLEWVTWGGGGIGDPLERPPEKVALEVRRRLVTLKGAMENYGVVLRGEDSSVDIDKTKALRSQLRGTRSDPWPARVYNRGCSMAQMREKCMEETGLPPPVPQWEREPYGPHLGVSYVHDWYTSMKEKNGWELE